MVDIEARVDRRSRIVNQVPSIAVIIVIIGKWWCRKWSLWRVDKCFFEELGIATGVRNIVQLLDEGSIQIKEWTPEVDKTGCWDVIAYRVIAVDSVVHKDGAQVVVGGVVRVQESVCKIWDIIACVRFTSNVDRVSLHSECVDKVLEETHELSCDVFLAGCGHVALSEAGAYGQISLRFREE